MPRPKGLSVLVVETRAFGGQAGASDRIENYLGFPTGISGQALTARAFVQAQKFGAQFVIPLEVARLDCGGGLERPMALEMDRWLARAGGDRRDRLGRALPQALAAQSRAVPVNRGLWYWASPIEAKLCANAEVVIVGGGNSAGQAAVFLAAPCREGLDPGPRQPASPRPCRAT